MERDAFEVAVSAPLLVECERALGYPWVVRLHGLDQNARMAAIDGFRQFGILVEVVEVPAIVEGDPADDMVIATAVAGDAGYIVSGVQDLLRLGEHRGIAILPPRAFLAVLDLNPS